jgi:hypothetical protein
MTTEPECRHDTIGEAAGIRVCLDCGQPNPIRPPEDPRYSAAYVAPRSQRRSSNRRSNG